MIEKLCYQVTAGDGHVFVFVEKHTIDKHGERVAVLAEAWKILMGDPNNRDWHEPRTGKTKAMLKKLCMSYGEPKVMGQFFMTCSFKKVESSPSIIPGGNRHAGGNI